MSITHNAGSTGLVYPRNAVYDESPSPFVPLALPQLPRGRKVSKQYPLTPLSLKTRSRTTSFAPSVPSPLSSLAASSGISVRVAARNGKSWSVMVLDGLQAGEPIGQRIRNEMGISNHDAGDSPIHIYPAKWPSPVPIGIPLTENALKSILQAQGKDTLCHLTLFSAGPFHTQSFAPVTYSSKLTSDNGNRGALPLFPFEEPTSPVSPGGYDGSDEHAFMRLWKEHVPSSMGSSQSQRRPIVLTVNREDTDAASAKSPHTHSQRARKHAMVSSYNYPASLEASRQISRSVSRLEALSRVDLFSGMDVAAAGLGFIGLREHLRSCHSEGAVLPDLLLNSITTTQTFRRQARKLGPEPLCRLTAVLQNCVSHCCLSEEQGESLRLIQDLSTDCLICPKSYRLTGIVRGERIAGGGEATIYAGQHHGQPVVIREFHPPASNSWDDPIGQNVLKLIIREAVMHRQLRHENIVEFFGIWQEVDRTAPAMVLQRAEHGSVLTYLQLHPGPGPFLKLVDGIIAGLCYLHTRKPPLIHGDLHDSNIVVDSSGNALICDFGLSRIRYEITRTHTDVKQGGRLRYVAPELTTGPVPYRPNEASDTYSLAMTIFALGTGNSPFVGQNEFAAATNAKNGERPTRPRIFGGLERAEIKELWRIMREMWNADPSLRPCMPMVQASFRSLFHL